MALSGWCSKLTGTRTVAKGIVLGLLLAALSLSAYPHVSAKAVVVIVDEAREQMATRAKTVGQLLDEKGIYLRPHDRLSPSEDTRIIKGMEILLQRAVPVFVYVDGQAKLVYSSAEDTGQFLEEQGIQVGAQDRVTPAPDEALQKGTRIYVSRVGTELVREEAAIAFETVQKNDPELIRGRRKVMVEGKEGKLERIYEVVYVDGKEESRTLLEEKRMSEPVNRVVYIGTKEGPIMTASAREGRVSQVMEGMASWYGSEFHGRKTAYGDTFDMNELTAAFPSRDMRGKTLRVTYLRTGRSVDVVVNDYGPHVAGRIIDLSKAAAKAIGLMADGIGKVRVEILN